MEQSKVLLNKVTKYALNGLVIAFASSILPKNKLNIEEVLMLALIAAATFAILDNFLTDEYKDISNYARQGAGLGIGLKLVGFP